MAEQTTNYGLSKPLPEDFYDINVQNGNMDLIDAEIKAVSEKANQAFQSASNKANKSTVVTATLTMAWGGAAAPYTQTITVNGITEESNCTVGIAPNATVSQYTAGVEGQLHPSRQGTNTITITAFGDKPTIDIPIVVGILG